MIQESLLFGPGISADGFLGESHNNGGDRSLTENLRDSASVMVMGIHQEAEIAIVALSITKSGSGNGFYISGF